MTSEAMVTLLRELVEIESPTRSPGVRGVAERMASELAALGADVEILDGDHLRAEIHGRGRPLLVIGHTDTVWPVGTLETMPFRVEDGRAHGPATYDMKGGLVLLVVAIAEARTERALSVFLTADEELGSPTARPLLEEAAQDMAAALVVEPPGKNGDLKTSRKGVGRFVLKVQGRAAHSAVPAHGANAVEELAHQVLRLQGLNDEARGLTVTVGVVGGGTTYNVVPAAAEAKIDVRVERADEIAEVEAALRTLESTVPGTTLELTGGWTRPPLERSPGSSALFARAHEYGRELGLDLHEGHSRGGSDGNIVGALGVPVLDGLGPEGAGAHAVDEHVLVASLPVRAQILARLLRDPGID